MSGSIEVRKIFVEVGNLTDKSLHYILNYNIYQFIRNVSYKELQTALNL